MNEPKSPNQSIYPVSMSVNEQGHLCLGGIDVVDLAIDFDTPLWLIDQSTIQASIQAIRDGLAGYPNYQILYAGKAFLNLAMCRLISNYGLGLDVVSEGELYTAVKANIIADSIYMHGNNKSRDELKRGIAYGNVNIVADSFGELELILEIAVEMGKRVNVLMRLIPGVEPDTHDYIKTGQHGSKFGVKVDEVDSCVQFALDNSAYLNLCGFHAHIGSQAFELSDYQEMICVMAKIYADVKEKFNHELLVLDAGGGLGIAYQNNDQPAGLYHWAKLLADSVQKEFARYGLKLPLLCVEPGRSLIGTAGITLYRVGQCKFTQSGVKLVSVDGGMADNPRPVMYQARYHAVLANDMNRRPANDCVDIVGKFCESGDVLIRDADIDARTDDYIAVFSTGAYNYSMSSNYNRTPRPACLLINEGQAEIILRRENFDDLIAHDIVPVRLLDKI